MNFKCGSNGHNYIEPIPADMNNLVDRYIIECAECDQQYIMVMGIVEINILE